MIGLLSYGDQIRCGTYQLQSKFSSAANFFSDEAFAFVVDSSVGAGPMNIVLEGIRPGFCRSLEIHNDCIVLNDEHFAFNDSICFNSNIQIDDIDANKFKVNATIFENNLIQHSPSKSLTFLIDPARKNDFKTSFDLAVVNRFEMGLKKFLSDDYQTGVELIKGLGCGLTPSGDDFISGFLIALHVSQIILKTDFSQIISDIHKTAKGGNAFTNIFLDCAARGHVSGKYQKLIHALCHSEENEIIYCTQRILAVGATSGADQAVGFLTGIKRFVQ
jgi:hypothetical protein